DPVIPIPEERLLVKNEGDTLKIAPECALEFFDTAGHAKHHSSIYDPISNGIFTGDTVGIRYERLVREGIDFFLPSTSPYHFDPEMMPHSIGRIRDMHPDRIYYGHFGMTEKVTTALDQVSQWLNQFVEVGEQVVAEGKGYDELATRLMQRVKDHLRKEHIDD